MPPSRSLALRLSTIVASMLIGGSTLGAGGWSHRIDWNVPEAEAVKAGDRFNWQGRGPAQFIEYLKTELQVNHRETYPVGGCHIGWVQATDLAALQALAVSREPCARPIALGANVEPDLRTNVGAVARQILADHDEGGFPRAVCFAVFLKGLPPTGARNTER
jgi:hypothetical protein